MNEDAAFARGVGVFESNIARRRRLRGPSYAAQIMTLRAAFELMKLLRDDPGDLGGVLIFARQKEESRDHTP